MPQIDWDAVDRHTDIAYNRIVEACNKFKKVEAFAHNVHLSSYPSRVCVYFGALTEDGRRREVYDPVIGAMVAEKPTPQERNIIGTFVASLAHELGWRCWREWKYEQSVPHRMIYTFKPHYQKFTKGGEIDDKETQDAGHASA